jgi:hypothetical protein
VIVNDLNVRGFVVMPNEANSPLPVDPNAMLTNSISLESLYSVAGWNAKVLQPLGSMKKEQLAPGHTFDGLKPEHRLVAKQRFGIAALERPDQDSSYDAPSIPSSGILTDPRPALPPLPAEVDTSILSLLTRRPSALAELGTQQHTPELLPSGRPGETESVPSFARPSYVADFRNSYKRLGRE